MRTFLLDVYNKRLDIHYEIMQVQRELDAAEAFSDKSDAFQTTRGLWYCQLGDCEDIEHNALRLVGALLLLMNLRITNDRGDFLDKWDKSLEPLVELFAEDVMKIFNQVGAFNSRLKHILGEMLYQDSENCQAFYCHDKSPTNTETGLSLQEELPNMSLEGLKISLLERIRLTSWFALPRSMARLR